MRGATARHGHALSLAEPVGLEAQAEEYLMMALRLAEGADLDRFARLAGAALPARRIDRLVGSGHLGRRGRRIAATAEGRIVLNAVLTELLA